MTRQADFDRHLTEWLIAERPASPPEDLLEDVLARVATTRRRPGWAIADRWIWTRHARKVGLALRAAAVAAVLVLLLLALVAVAGVLGTPRPAPPFGLTTPGLIAFDTAEGIVVSRSDGTERKFITRGDGQAVSPTWSRDGLMLAFWTRPLSGGPWSLVVLDPHRNVSSRIADGVNLEGRESMFGWPSNISWAPDSRRLAYAADVEGGSGIFVADVERQDATLITDAALGGIDPAWSPDGAAIAYQAEKTRTLRIVAPDGSADRPLLRDMESVLWPDWSPDGSLIAVMGRVDEQWDIFVLSADGSNPQNVSNDPGDEFSPMWSPDGSRLAWARAPHDGSARGWVVTSDPTGTVQVEIRQPADLAPPIWSPDGTQLYSYVAEPDGSFSTLIVLDPDGVEPVVRLPAGGNVGNGNWQRRP